jgi:hypothetical protein
VSIFASSLSVADLLAETRFIHVRFVFRCLFGKCHCSDGSMNNIPAERIGASDIAIISLNALNSEMGAVCPVVTKDLFDDVAFLPPGTITMTTYNGTISPAGSLYGTGDALASSVTRNQMSRSGVLTDVCSSWLPPLPNHCTIFKLKSGVPLPAFRKKL